MEIKIKSINNGRIPKISIKGDAGADCYINGFKKIVDPDKKILKDLDVDKYTLQPLERIFCPLGFATVIPEGYYASLVPRSGMSLWRGLSIVNSPGTIDAGYRNEWGAIVVNLSNKPQTIKKGERICQLIIKKMVNYKFKEVNKLEESQRGLKGFGSTGNQ